jgi:hypothetical protein
MQPLCAKPGVSRAFSAGAFFYDPVPRALPQARIEMRLWRNSILTRLSKRQMLLQGLEADTPNAQRRTPNAQLTGHMLA